MGLPLAPSLQLVQLLFLALDPLFRSALCCPAPCTLPLPQPVATALFANSPFKEGKPTGYLSWRSHVWTDTDPDR